MRRVHGILCTETPAAFKTRMKTPTPDDVPRLIRELYGIVAQLEAIFDGRHFTPDGHLVGSLGEALASHYYGVKLNKASTEAHDGVRDGRRVEVKVTQGDRVALSSCPEHLLVFRLLPTGEFEECFNGPGALAWALVAQRKSTKNSQHQVSLSALRRLMAAAVAAHEMLEPVLSLPAGTVRAPCQSREQVRRTVEDRDAILLGVADGVPGRTEKG